MRQSSPTKWNMKGPLSRLFPVFLLVLTFCFILAEAIAMRKKGDPQRWLENGSGAVCFFSQSVAVATSCVLCWYMRENNALGRVFGHACRAEVDTRSYPPPTAEYGW